MAKIIALKGDVSRVLKFRFRSGQFHLEPGIEGVFGLDFIGNSILQHLCGNWGLVDATTWWLNDEELRAGEGEVTSRYRHSQSRILRMTTLLEAPETVIMEDLSH